MTVAEWLSITAALSCALAVLPGSLGVLVWTNNLAAGTRGARYIYGRAAGVLGLSAILLAAALYQAASGGGVSTVFVAGVIAYAGVLVFGFVMHTKLMFKPIRKPMFISVDEAIQRFGPDEEVIGVTDRGRRPFAFITRLARRPHIVHQPDGDTPFVMTHCILSHSSMGYAAEGRFRQPELAVAAALANNLVIYDKNNACAISQIQNESRDQNLALDPLPTVSVSLKTWQALYPESQVWIRRFTWRDTFFLQVLSRTDIIDPDSPKLVYPLRRPRDDRLPLKSQVVGVKVGNEAKAYPVPLFEQPRIINDTIGGKSLAVASAYDGDYIQVFDRELDGSTLTLRSADDGDGFIDEQTGSRFSPTGKCVEGTYQGRQLEPIPHYNKIFWFPWVDYYPETEVFSLEARARSA